MSEHGKEPRGVGALLAFVAGLIFGSGLIIGGMTQPEKVTAFLDFGGAWDPSLAMVMGGALGTHALLSRLILRRPAPLLDRRFHLPTRRDLDRRLLAGAALFGLGWGIGGYCPGPGLTALAAGGPALVFVGAMIAGMFAFQVFEKALARATKSGGGA
jgi:uncharacterized membrane protein YedE/YeeE